MRLSRLAGLRAVRSATSAPLYSYLALAGGDKNEDGLLEAWELMRLDLKADLAVLSACETARGRFGAGEGVIGLTWASPSSRFGIFSRMIGSYP